MASHTTIIIFLSLAAVIKWQRDLILLSSSIFDRPSSPVKKPIVERAVMASFFFMIPCMKLLYFLLRKFYSDQHCTVNYLDTLNTLVAHGIGANQ